MAPKIGTRKDGSPRRLVRPRCRHENVDHYDIAVNGTVRIEWLQCLDCELVFKLRRVACGGR